MKSRKVLIVDDVDLSLEMERRVLSRLKCNVLTARCGDEALEIMDREKPSLVMLDLYMPGMLGDECCRHIKSDPHFENTPIIMTTAGFKNSRYTLEDRAKCISAGCSDFIAKPFKMSELANKAGKYLDIKIREYMRVPTFVEVYFRSGGNVYRGYLHDLSEGGLFIKSDTPFPEESHLEMVFTLPDKSTFVEAEGMVTRVVSSTTKHCPDEVIGMGVQFTKLSADMKRALRFYVNPRFSRALSQIYARIERHKSPESQALAVA